MTRGLLLAGALAALCPTLAMGQNGASDTRPVIERFVETKRLISEEKKRWKLARQILENQIAVRERSIGTAEEKLAELRRAGQEPAAGARSDREREQLRQAVNESFGELAKLRRKTALAKVGQVVEHLENARSKPRRRSSCSHTIATSSRRWPSRSARAP